MQRRDFLKILMAGTSAAVILPYAGLAALARSDNATALPIPELMRGEMKDGVRV